MINVGPTCMRYTKKHTQEKEKPLFLLFYFRHSNVALLYKYQCKSLLEKRRQKLKKLISYSVREKNNGMEEMLYGCDTSTFGVSNIYKLSCLVMAQSSYATAHHRGRNKFERPPLMGIGNDEGNCRCLYVFDFKI